MNSVVVYATRSGNTRTVAEAIAGALAAFGPARAVAAEEAPATVWHGADLLIVGGPTENRHYTPALHAFFDRLPAHALTGIPAAAFETRLDWPRLLRGSAAADIRRCLDRAEAEVIGPDKSFVVTMEPALEQGEVGRAMDWARQLAASWSAQVTPAERVPASAA